jgi:hypothetical protein
MTVAEICVLELLQDKNLEVINYARRFVIWHTMLASDF